MAFLYSQLFIVVEVTRKHFGRVNISLETIRRLRSRCRNGVDGPGCCMPLPRGA
jgi:hypothetical protein